MQESLGQWALARPLLTWCQWLTGDGLAGRRETRECALLSPLSIVAVYIYMHHTGMEVEQHYCIGSALPSRHCQKKRPFCLYAGRNGQNGEGVSTRQSRHRHRLLPHPNSGFLQLCSWPPIFISAQPSPKIRGIPDMLFFIFSANTEEIVG
jgi:hypothetical protein